MFAISLFLGIQRFFVLWFILLLMKKIHRAFNTFYLLAKNSFSAVEGERGRGRLGGGAEFLVFLVSEIDT